MTVPAYRRYLKIIVIPVLCLILGGVLVARLAARSTKARPTGSTRLSLATSPPQKANTSGSRAATGTRTTEAPPIVSSPPKSNVAREPKIDIRDESNAVRSAETKIVAAEGLAMADLESALRCNPFSPASVLPPPDPGKASKQAAQAAAKAESNARQQFQARIAEISKKKASLIFRGPQGPVAIIEGRTLQAGDQISPGVRIVAIETTGIVVEVTSDPAS
jgi:hypothetical protein